MASEKKIVVLRASKTEEPMLDFLVAKTGMSMSRVLGLALRRLAEEEGYKPGSLTIAANQSGEEVHGASGRE